MKKKNKNIISRVLLVLGVLLFAFMVLGFGTGLIPVLIMNSETEIMEEEYDWLVINYDQNYKIKKYWRSETKPYDPYTIVEGLAFRDKHGGKWKMEGKFTVYKILETEWDNKFKEIVDGYFKEK